MKIEPTRAEIRQMLIDLNPEFRKASELMIVAARHCAIEWHRRMEANAAKGNEE